MTTAAGLAVLAIVLFGPAGVLLARSIWPRTAPRAAVVLWQATGLAGALAAIGSGLAVTVAPMHVRLLTGVRRLIEQARAGHPLAGLGVYGAIGLTVATDVSAVLIAGLIATTIHTARTRLRHRRVLDLVGTRSELIPGALLLDDPRAAAYYLPGLRPRIVVSAGTLGLLSNGGLAAVLDHERGHARERHSIVMLPFASMDTLLRWMPYARRARSEVADLLEMAADDYATRKNDRHALATALVAMSTSSTSYTCTFAASTTGLVARVTRLIEPSQPSRTTAAVAIGAAALVVALPLTVTMIS
jgi:Zn-dependent protease with chaperone function